MQRASFVRSQQLQQGKFDVCISLLSIGALLQLWIPCYIGSLLRAKVNAAIIKYLPNTFL